MAKDRHLSAAAADVCESGSLLADLERRQDDVLAQLDALDRQLTDLLKGLGVTLVDDPEAGTAAAEFQSAIGGDEEADSAVAPPAGGAGQDGQAPWPTGGFAKLPAEHGIASVAAGGDQTRAA